MTAQPASPLARPAKPAAPVPAGARPDAIADFLNHLLKQYEKTAGEFQSKSGSTSPL